jgi:hypothetical protein
VRYDGDCAGATYQHLATIERLFRSVENIRELADGYSFQLPPDKLLTAAQFISLERLCCPFFDFGLEVKCNGSAVWLTPTGREGAKQFIMAEIGDHLPASLS